MSNYEDLEKVLRRLDMGVVSQTAAVNWVKTYLSEEKAKVWDEAFNIAAECFSEGKSYDKFLHRWSEASAAKEKKIKK